jgi:hypothetical protein
VRGASPLGSSLKTPQVNGPSSASPFGSLLKTPQVRGL